MVIDFFRRQIPQGLFIVLILSSCKPSRFDNLNGVTIDTSRIAIFQYDTTLYDRDSNMIIGILFRGGATKTELTVDELKRIELLFGDCIQELNEQNLKEYDDNNGIFFGEKRPREEFFVKGERYRRQYVPAVTSKGDKEVWVNCIPYRKNEGASWRTNIEDGLGGGVRHFRFYVNLATNQYYNLHPNAPL